MMTVRYTAEMTDPITQETTTIVATSEVELEHLVDQHLQRSYPDPEPVSHESTLTAVVLGPDGPSWPPPSPRPGRLGTSISNCESGYGSMS